MVFDFPLVFLPDILSLTAVDNEGGHSRSVCWGCGKEEEGEKMHNVVFPGGKPLL